MAKTLIIVILSLATTGLAFGAERVPDQNAQGGIHPYLWEGFVFEGVDGTVSKVGKEDRWVFAAEIDITDTKGVIKAGVKTELLYSSTLEQITTQADEKTSFNVKLWARVTRYSNSNLFDIDDREEKSFDKNFLFPYFFIPLTQIPKPEISKEEDKGDESTEAPPEKPDEESIIPAEVMERLKPERVVNLRQLKKVIKTQKDVMLVNRTGFVVSGTVGKEFKLDGVGRNVEDISFRLLQCEGLQRTEHNLAISAERQRYRIAGIVTKYKGGYYMLLSRAVRTYTHGNFAR